MNDAASESTAVIHETIVFELRNGEGMLKQRTTVKDGIETIEKFPEEVK